MSRARCSAAVAFLLLAVSACMASRVDPEADISIRGEVRASGDVAIENARLALIREPDAGDVLFFVTSIGLLCLADEPRPAVCRSARLTSTGGDGAFSYTLKGRDTQATLGTSAVLRLTALVDRKGEEVQGATTDYRFHAQTESLELPVRIWQPDLAARTGSFGARVSFPHVVDSLVPRELAARGFRYSVHFFRSDEPVWTMSMVDPEPRFDPRVLEDTSGEMRVTAAINDVRVADRLGTEIALALRSGTRAYRSPLGAPLSRGKRCAVAVASGAQIGQSPCRLTDGNFSEDFRPTVCATPNCPEPAHTSAVVDLERVEPVDFIVVRGCSDRCLIETSTDLRSWKLAEVAGSDQASVSLVPARPARYVRVSGEDSVDDLREISVWNGTPAVPEGSLLVAPPRFPAGAGPGGARGGSGSRGGVGAWALVAVGLLGVAAGGLIIFLLRRRGRAA